ncbi:hypothetical protein VF21_00138 [Pseudogymnoascus sp. 05NY08]|nr:hypothetical protein VF21_00157 [Pseudogymnoascus sp. 05NY08]OBT81031.1 hypothetical protein VF21_00138 [Pseudogymnoascus sp. 05NY08]
MSSPPAPESVDIPLRVQKRTAPSGEVPAPPQPLQDASGYTKDRLELGLEYANAVLLINGRNLPPIGRRTLSLYKEACTQLLLLNEGGYTDIKGVEKVRSELLGTIRMFEESRKYKPCLSVARSKDEAELAEEIMRLQRTAFYARYGDVFGEACKLLRHEAEAGKVTGWSGLNHRYWTTISKLLVDEKPWYKRLHKGEPVYDECPTHLTVIETCKRLGFETDDMIAAIYHYAQRNELLHSNLLPLIKDGNYTDLAIMLQKDYVHVPCVVEAGEVIQEKLFLNVIEAMINVWFIKDDPEAPENPQTWVATKALKMRAGQLRGPSPRDEAKVNKEITEEIHKALARRLRSERKSREMSAVFESALILADPKKRVKRVASAELEGEMEGAKRQKREWDKLENLTWNVHSLKVAYEDTWGEFLPPAIPLADPWLDGMEYEPSPEPEPAPESASESESEPAHKHTPSPSPTPEIMNIVEPDVIMGLGGGIEDGDIELGGTDSEDEPQEYDMY